nr:P3N-PIPO [Paris mosaic necrosis virus]
EWHVLSWWEKCYITWQLKKFTPSTEKFLTRKAALEKGEFSRKFVSACFMKAQTHLKSSRDIIYKKCE